MTRPIRTLLFSTLYPSRVRPSHGIFVETRLRELLKTGEVETKVIAPVPWFPLRGAVFGEYGKMAAIPVREVHNGIDVSHPRYFLPPKVGMNIAPQTLAWSALAEARKLIAGGFDFDLIDAHYYYPDGVAAAAIARALGKPLVITARGTDLNLIPRFSRPRQRILESASQAQASVGVCKALMDCLADLGADRSKLHVLRNGVDLERFRPLPRSEARERLGLADAELAGQTIILSVGHLIERKGHHIAIEAMRHLPRETHLFIIGEGEMRQALEAQARNTGVGERIRFTGALPQAELAWWYSAADVLVLCSSREGWANVLLESMACGTPVVATNIWGTPEVVSTPEAGVLMADRTPGALVESLGILLGRNPARDAVRRYAEQFSWQATTEGQLDLFRKIIAGHARRDAADRLAAP